MLNQEVENLLNDQINKELYSAYLYMGMTNYYSNQSLNGFENWFKVQMREELDHADLFRTYMLNMDKEINLETVSAPKIKFNTFKDPISIALEHERSVTASINNIYDAAYRNKDFHTMQFLDWFVKEQGEEEKNIDNLLKRYDLFGSDSKGLYMLDSELGTRVYAAPTLVL